MNRIAPPLALFALLTCGVFAFFIFYGKSLPPTMAVKFNQAGAPVEMMDRVKFIVMATSTSFLLPTFVVALVGVLPRIAPNANLNVPDKEYWTASTERREALMNRMLSFGLWLGCLIQVILCAVWISIARANAAAGSPVERSYGTGWLVFLVPVAAVMVILLMFGAMSRPRN